MKKSLLVLPTLSLALLSCSGGAPLTVGDYTVNLSIFSAEKQDVTIMQLTDIHWNMATDLDKQILYLETLVSKGNPDIIMLTGDCCLVANTDNWTSLFQTMDSLKKNDGTHIYWGVVWGNHDRTGLYAPNYPSDLAASYSNAYYEYTKQNTDHYGIFADPDDDIQGRSNYVVNLLDEEGSIAWQLWGLDSNTDYYLGSHYSYDIIHEDQIEWFEDAAAETRNGGSNIPGLAFIHIPLLQTAMAYQSVLDGESLAHGGELRETPNEQHPLYGQLSPEACASYSGYKESGFYDAAKENGVVGIFYGHDHINDFWADYNDVLLAYGTKTGSELYYQTGLMGASMMRIHADGSFDFSSRPSVSAWQDDGPDYQQILLGYEDLGL